MIPQRTLTGVCEIKNGQFMVMNRPPIFTGEKAALQVECSFNFNGEAYTIPSGVVAEMYLRYPNTDKMTVAVEMSISGNTAVGVISDEQTGLAGYPLLVIQLTDIISGSLIVACSCPVKISDVRGNLVIDSRAPSPSEVVYVGRSPYIDSTTGNWMEWDLQQNDYIDTGVHAKGDKGDKGDTGAAAGFGTPTATVDSNVGTPSVGISASGPDTAKVFNFAFHNLKGEKGNTGNTGAAAGFGTPSASVDANVGTPSVDVSASGPDTAKVFNFAFHNLKGEKGNTGNTGAAAGFGTPTATVDSNVGTPSVDVTASGPDTAKVFGFQFHNMKGEKGDTGDPTSSTAEDIHMSPTDTTTIYDAITDLKSALKSGKKEDAIWHLGFYLDENGDLCQE